MNAIGSQLKLNLDHTRELLVRWFVPGPPTSQNNVLNLYREIAWYGVLSSVTLTFTSVFALRLGASNLLIGLLSSLPALVNVIFQIPAARLIERHQDRRRILMRAGFWLRLPVGLIALVPFFGGRLQAEAVVLITALGTIPAALGNVSFTAMLADVVPPYRRARVVSVRNALLSAVTMLTAVAVGEALDWLPFPVSYQLIFALAFGASLVSLFYLARIAVPPGPVFVKRAGAGGHTDVRVWARTVWAQRGYSRFTLGAFVWHWALNFPAPLYSIYRVRELKLSEGWIGTLSMIESAILMVAYYFWGKVAEKRGSRLVLMLGVFGLSFYPLGVGLSRSIGPLLLMQPVAGIFAPAFNLGLFNSLLEVAPAERRATYIAIFNTLINVSAFGAPLIATAVSEVIGTRDALLVGSALRFVAGFVMAALLKGPSAGARLAAPRGQAAP
jgi:MFS family permease